jgi:methionyl-tRNA formyltransferase
MRSIVLCGATEKGLAVVRALRHAQRRPRVTVVTFREINVSHSYHDEIRETSLSSGFRFVDLPTWRENAEQIIRQEEAEAIVCVGWRYLISDQISALVASNVIVGHDSLLPRYRGFAPLPTAMICGEREAGVTFLRASSEVDAGPVYWQRTVPITADDTIQDLIEKTLPLYCDGLLQLVNGGLPAPVAQDEGAATYSIWRDDFDYVIDWGLDAAVIERTIRALGSPYLGARSSANGREIVINRGAVVKDVRFALRQPGKVWSIDENGCPVVTCGTGMLKVVDARFASGDVALPWSQLRTRFQ